VPSLRRGRIDGQEDLSLFRDWKDVLFLPIGSLDLALDGRWDQSCKGLARRHPLFTSTLTGWLFLCVACRQTAPTAPAAPPGNPSQGAERVFRMGIMGPFTGPSARTGEEFRQAATMAFEKVHNKIGDYKVELVWIDEQSDPAKAARAYEEAVIRNKIEAGLLNWHSSVAVACMEVTAKYKVPHFFGNGATEIVNEKYQFAPETIPDPVVNKGYFIFPVIQYSGGEGKIIWPPEWKEKDLQPPQQW
jgi:Periplasmic binding protein